MKYDERYQSEDLLRYRVSSACEKVDDKDVIEITIRHTGVRRHEGGIDIFEMTRSQIFERYQAGKISEENWLGLQTFFPTV